MTWEVGNARVTAQRSGRGRGTFLKRGADGEPREGKPAEEECPRPGGSAGAPRLGSRGRPWGQREGQRGPDGPVAVPGPGCAGGGGGVGLGRGVGGQGGPGSRRGRGPAGGRPRPTSLSGTHCGSSRPNGLPKARCSGTMRRPLGERTSFLASRRAATSEDMTPPHSSPAARRPPPATRPSPPRSPAPPRPASEADGARAQSPRPAWSTGQSASGARPIAEVSNRRKGTSPATLRPATNRQ